MGLNFIHLSDIHFKQVKGNELLDLDLDVRNELEIDLKDIMNDVKKIDAILITGDIAFKGLDEEFEIASKWLENICDITKCLKQNILTVPGNHDVDRDKINEMLYDSQTSLKKLKDRTKIDEKLYNYLKDKETCASLLVAFKNYEDFAQKYNTIPQFASGGINTIKQQNRLFWEKDFKLSKKILRVRGLNSAIVSNKDDDEHKSKLFLSSYQTQLIRENGVIYMTLCHHPPQWLYDGDMVDIDLISRSKIQLFGHKHIFGCTKLDDSLRLSAGAVHPSRKEKDWEPRYNIIQLRLKKNARHNYLEIKVWKRIWDKKNKFKADFEDDGKIFEVHNLIVDPNDYKKNGEKVNQSKKQINKKKKKMFMKESNEIINKPNPLRELLYLFLKLPYHKRLRVAFNLSLIEDSDKNLTEVEKSKEYFSRAKSKNLLEQLKSEIIKMQK